MAKMNDVHPDAAIGKNVQIGNFSFIAADVHIGDNTIIEPHVTILSGSRIGSDCHIFPGAVIGGDPQDMSYKGEKTTVNIGNNVTIREFCTIHRGSTARWKTTIGNNCYLMAYVHIAHDCIIGDHCIFANVVNLGGHVEIGEHANLGGLVAVHQFSKIGKQVMIGGGSIVRKDVPPYVKAAREPLSYIGLNSIGLKRRGFSGEEINLLTDIYRVLFIKNRNMSNGVDDLMNNVADSTYKTEILIFIKDSERGLIKGLSKNY